MSIIAKHGKTAKRLTAHLAVIVLLCFMLALTTWALVASFVSVDGNVFEMGTVKIELNGGKTVFDGTDMNVEPGHSLVREFTVANTGTADVYYRLYLENVTGSLQEALIFEIYDGTTLLFRGTASEWNRESPCEDGAVLPSGETRTLTAVVKMQESAGNAYQGGGITFDMTVDAVQAKNNPDAAFS